MFVVFKQIFAHINDVWRPNPYGAGVTGRVTERDTGRL